MIGHFFFSIQICASMSPPRKDTLPRRFPHSPLWFFTICNPDSPIIFITYYNDTSIICLPVCSISHNELQDPPKVRVICTTVLFPKANPVFPRVFRVWEIVCRWMNVKMINSGHGCRRDLSRKGLICEAAGVDPSTGYKNVVKEHLFSILFRCISYSMFLKHIRISTQHPLLVLGTGSSLEEGLGLIHQFIPSPERSAGYRTGNWDLFAECNRNEILEVSFSLDEGNWNNSRCYPLISFCPSFVWVGLTFLAGCKGLYSWGKIDDKNRIKSSSWM